MINFIWFGGLAGSGREAHGHREMAAEGQDPAEEGEGDVEEEEVTATALVKLIIQGK